MVDAVTYTQYGGHKQGRDSHPASQVPNNHKSLMDDCVLSERTNKIYTSTDTNSNSSTKHSSNDLNELKAPPSSSSINSCPMDAKEFMGMAQSTALKPTPAVVKPVVRRSFRPGTHEFRGLMARNDDAYRRDIELTTTCAKSYHPVANPPLDYLYSGLEDELPDAGQNQSQLPNIQSTIAVDSYSYRGGISALLTTHRDNEGTQRKQLFNDNDESVTRYTGGASATMKRTNRKGVHAINQSNITFHHDHDMQTDIFDPLDSFRSPCPTPRESESEEEAALAQGIAQIETQQKTLVDISLSNHHLIQQLAVDTKAKASAPHREHQKSIDALKAKMDNLEREKLDYQSQIEKMTQIVSQLSKRGLPHPPDDSYLKDELDGLAYDIMQFSRAFTRGLKKLTPESLSKIYMSENVKKYLHGHFVDLNGLVSSGRGETRLRTRCVQVIMFERLTNHPLRVHPIGLLDDHCHHINQTLASNMSCSDEETHMWKALTVHLLSKNNKMFLQQQEKEINALTESVYEDIAEWGEFRRVGKDELKEIVTKVAKLGLELAQLPFGIVPLDLKPGAPFDGHHMKDADEDKNEDGIVGKTTIILSYPWVKMRFDEDGKKAMDSKNILSRAQVSCLQ